MRLKLALALVLLTACRAPSAVSVPTSCPGANLAVAAGQQDRAQPDVLQVSQVPAAAPREPIDAETVMSQLRALPAPRSPGSSGHAAGRAFLESRLRELGYTPRLQSFGWAGAPGVDLQNLEISLGHGDQAGPVLLVCAHYDTVPFSPGADDNGSGVAVLLELARRLSGKDLGLEVRLVFLDAEEVGLVGSRAYLEALGAVQRARIVGVINLESVGYADRRPGSQAMPEFTRMLLDPGSTGDFVLIVANQDSAWLGSQVHHALGATSQGQLRSVLYDRLPGAGWLVPDSRRSDHASFWDAGISAVMLTDTAPFRNPHYHRRSDLPATLDGEFLAAVARGVERAVIVLAGELSE